MIILNGLRCLAGTALSRVEALQRLERNNASEGAQLWSHLLSRLSLGKRYAAAVVAGRAISCDLMEPSIPEDEAGRV